MSISSTLQSYLDRQKVPYHLRHHPYTETAMRSAFAARVPAHRVAKGVVLKDEEGFVMAVVPSDRQVDLNAVNRSLNRLLEPAAQRDVRILFRDCDPGAVPSLGQAYNMKIIWDDSLAKEQACFIESGDHTELLELDHQSFIQLMEHQPHGLISCH
ncbi:aminoacyl-tRNA deacylase [Marinobacterium lutimaris]|uniref:Ala-tRNA(Pro) deacylase n=1 Tax=Marinobacterium lutimaris TaxID=568106 RepID=A0A1H5WD95_9GAMM|nr:YbaK/EbsC family protein [Marinobacterium lutimaris]SEF97161.1 Ala-tRNA(Pro) deacylase [Marinobacterium lutimaris]